jgi:hypothetical protein
MAPLRCLLGFHDWTVEHDPDGHPYTECRHCHADPPEGVVTRLTRSPR